MSTETTIKPADLARHWRVSPAYVSGLAKRKAMPAFPNLAEADAWRALNAPPKPALEAVRNSSEAGQSREKNRVLTPPQHSAKDDGAEVNIESGNDVVDITPFISRSGDFDTLMVEDAEAMPKIARGLFDRACRNLNIAEIANFLKIWNASAAQAAEIRQRFLDLKERTRALIAMDDVEDVLGTELQALRSTMMRLGTTHAARANPADPALAQTVIDAAVDAMWRQLEIGIELAKRELVEGLTEPTATPDSSAPASVAS